MERISLTAVEEAYHTALGRTAFPSMVIVEDRWIVSTRGLARVDGQPVTADDWRDLRLWLRGREAGRDA